MNAKDIFDGVTDIRDDLIAGAEAAPRKRRTKRRWPGAVAAVLVLAILGGIFLRPAGGLTAYAIAQVKYPEMAPYPNETDYVNPDGVVDNSFGEAYHAWAEDMRAQRRDLGDISPLQSFFARSTRTFLTGAERENRVYSPLNVYLALSILAQLTDGESREQILTLLGSGSMDELRQQAGDVWNANYRDDGSMTSVLASSLWLDRNVKFDQDAMDTLARDFYASSYRGEMGSERFNKALRDWINEQTGGLLENQAGNIELDRETILALAATVYFKAKWHNEFSKEETAPQTFHAPVGDVKADFMHQRDIAIYCWGDRFTAVSQSFETGGTMWFLLPDDGVTPEELLSDGEAMDFLFSTEKSGWEKQKFLYVNKSIPKFDVSSQFDLGDGLQALGVTHVFDPALSDFTPMTTDADAPIVLSQADHAARVVIDEEGCTAASFAVMALGMGGPPEEEVNFVLDRPFLFFITGDSGLPLFVGIVNCPAEK